jgi:hypothetical protein
LPIKASPTQPGRRPIDLGPIQVTTERTKRFPLPPIVGAVALVGGIVLLVAGNRK